MDELRTEEEQIAALKNWWSNNGNSLLMGIGLTVAVFFGWKAFESGQIKQKSEASQMYQQLINAAMTQSIESDDSETIAFLANDLKSKFEDTEYAIYASLFIAKASVKNKDYSTAISELEWVLTKTEDSKLHHIVNGRIARILSAQDQHEEALARLVAKDPTFEANYLEIIGDIKKRTGDEDGAIESYKKAFSLTKGSPQSLPLLAVKLSDLGVNPDTL